MLAQSAPARNRTFPVSHYLRTVMLDTRLRRSAKVLAATIAAHRDGAPCFISRDELLRNCCTTYETLCKARQVLERCGYLQLERRGPVVIRYVPTLPQTAEVVS